MRRVLVQQWVSVDGKVAGPNGETDAFDAVPDFSPSDRHNAALLGSVDEVVLGRRTYEEFVQFWPTAEGEALAPLVNALPKTVASGRQERDDDRVGQHHRDARSAARRSGGRPRAVRGTGAARHRHAVARSGRARRASDAAGQ